MHQILNQKTVQNVKCMKIERQNQVLSRLRKPEKRFLRCVSSHDLSAKQVVMAPSIASSHVVPGTNSHRTTSRARNYPRVLLVNIANISISKLHHSIFREEHMQSKSKRLQVSLALKKQIFLQTNNSQYPSNFKFNEKRYNITPHVCEAMFYRTTETYHTRHRSDSGLCMLRIPISKLLFRNYQYLIDFLPLVWVNLLFEFIDFDWDT